MPLTSEKMMVTIPGEGEFHCYVAKPEKLPAPAVIVIQEIFGITPHLRAACDNLAQEGYVGIAPDLFWRMEPGVVLNPDIEADFQHAFGLYQRFDQDKGMSDLTFLLKHVRGLPEVKGRVGCMGYCLGGLLAYLMSTRTDADCSVGYYGVGIESFLKESENIKKPLLLHFAGADKFVPKEAQEIIKRTLADNPNVFVHIYDGLDHGFARLGGHAYNKAGADLANSRTSEFFRKHLA
ncbi:MAG TPA: dienelactone hydrolase family protein [Candidatus Obscuribacterales bacterium]